VRTTANRANLLLLLGAVIVSLVLPGCAAVPLRESLSAQATPVATPSMVRPGVYTAQHLDEIPLPTESYQVYIVGEQHGVAEVRQLFADYLERLYAGGLRDVILEAPQGYQPDASAFVLGEVDTLIEGLCLYADVLQAIRDFNDGLTPDEKAHVHLVDLDFSSAAVHTHLLSIRHRLGEVAQDVEIPLLDEFQNWDEHEMASLAEHLAGTAGEASPRILRELNTAQDSIRHIHLFASSEAPLEPTPGSIWQHGMAVREVRITENIQHVLLDLEGKPVLALYGVAHAKKTGDDNILERSWAQRLSEDGIEVYSLFATGMYGTAFWGGRSYSVGWKPETWLFLPPDGVSLATVLNDASDYEIIYIDPQETSNLILPTGERASGSYNGIVLFREISPMADACP